MKNVISKSILLFAAIVCLASCLNHFDINKEGCVKTVIEISTKDIVKALSHDSQDPTFLQAMELAEKRKHDSDSDFMTLFGEAYEELDPNARLVSIFLYELKDRGININSSNDEVLKVLRQECEDAFSRSYQIIGTRLARYSEEQSTLTNKFKYNLTRTENSERIQLELSPNAVEDAQMYRIRRLLQETARLEFWETGDYADVEPYLMEMGSDTTSIGRYEDETRSLPEILHVENAKGACIGCVALRDTALVNQMLNNTKELASRPRNIKFAWTISPRTISSNGNGTEMLDLIALKVSRDNRCALGGEVLTDARQEFNQYNQAEVAIQMNPEGAKAWKRFTGDNIGKQIAIVIDDYVFSYPVVNTEIPNGKASIFYEGMTKETAQDLANVLNAGKLPAPVRIIEEAFVEPNNGR